MSSLGPRAGGLRLIRIVLVCVAVGLVVNSAGGVLLYIQAQSQASQTTDALCALRRDMQVRVESSLTFLRDHPNGIPGINAQTIRTGVENQVRTIRALSSIDCPK